MEDVSCPYCGYDQDIDHDDGYGYAENVVHNQECVDCEKTFTFTTSISYDYEVEKAPCLNGEEHNWKSVNHFPPVFPEWKRCTCCDEEIRGKYDSLKENEND
jgi:glutaredoxin